MADVGAGGEADRVREGTAGEINARLDREASGRVARYAARGAGEITRRIGELEREWDIERVPETNASALAFLGVALAAAHSRKWLVLPGAVTPFLFQHAVQGWCPPVPLFRRLGVRTREEIDREKYALKALRGDFEGAGVGADPRLRAQSALRAADA